MPSLDARLEAVLGLVHAHSHADIGSDHASLPIELIHRGQIVRGVIVELNSGPLLLARQNVRRAGLQDRIDVRAGDGFSPLAPGEVQSASLSGMGAQTMLGILDRAGETLPPALILQPNDSPRRVRVWALAHGYHLSAERLAEGHWTYPVLRLEQRGGPDPAYAGLPLDAALRYGPHLLGSGDPLARRQVWADIVRLSKVAAPGRPAEGDLAVAQAALSWLNR
ncbi:tRNA (adenine(22)-N(1))-methyltransferase TrmK [Deinococcus koreensis]|uniref:tRNA (Adenine-N(1))-methyltransferase n=1 Tax=Deinococcus koreensis TaxID=2054903 RepID=A0A2K3UXW1_9DEIO|nr:tRNA (adenine(22)-N(1))-methyltransferase TrmK [Deinococcus koreensis]PNY81364.1 tRNA (adenine-N(1))-methyltransferase [Deinococcus koreensis]